MIVFFQGRLRGTISGSTLGRWTVRLRASPEFVHLLEVAYANDQPLLQKPFFTGILLRKLEVEEVLASWSRL